MPRLALILSGAVSLGSFEAGVVDELLYALDRLARLGGRAFTLDVIAGASAGAMTGALVARSVLLNEGRRGPLREAWVEGLDLDVLLEGGPRNSLLSDVAIRHIAERYVGDPDPAGIPAPFAPAHLHLSFALSNLNGIDYRLGTRLPSDPPFLATVFRERRRFVVTPESAREAGTWVPLRAAALASGAFPFAFPPVALPTTGGEYGDPAHEPLPEAFAYVDGGLFDNEPIGEAVALARIADEAAGGDDPERIFLLVDASLNRSAHDPGYGPDTELLRLAPRLFAMIRGEASGNDWLRARRVNNELEWRDSLARAIALLVEASPSEARTALEREAEDAARRIVDTKRAVLGEDRYPAGYLDRALARTRVRDAAALSELDPDSARILEKLLFVLNSAAGLDRKEHLELGLIHAEAGETAGERLAGFGGFFERAWREHDYRVGRKKAARILPSILGVDPWPPEPGVHYDPEFDASAVEMGDADRGKRETLREHALTRTRELTYELMAGRPAIVRWAGWRLARVVVDRHLRRALDL